VIYPFRGSELPAWQVISSILVLLACTVIAIFQLRNRPYLAIGWFWYIGTLVPVIGIVQVGIQANADRYNYVPLIGIFIITAWALGELVESTPISKPFLIAACFACLLGLGAATNTQVGYWRNSTTLFQHA